MVSRKCCAKFREKWPMLQELYRHKKNKKLVNVLLKSYSQDPSFCSAVRTIAKNVANRNVLIKGPLKAKLMRHKKKIAALARKGNKNQAKLVRQSGGFLPLLLPLISSVAGPILNAVLNKRRR